MEADRLSTLAGFAGALVVLGVLLYLVGIDAILETLRGADPGVMAAAVLTAAGWLVAWGLALRVVLVTVGIPMTAPKAVLLYAAAVFADNVTPFGQAGGEPLSALIIRTATDRDYETCLAAIASVDTLNVVPSVSFAIVGFVFVIATAIELTRSLVFGAVAVAVLSVALPTAAYLGWRHREGVEAAVVGQLTPVLQFFGRHLPRVSPPSAALIEQRIERFFVAIDRVAGDPRTLVTALGFSAIGWLALAVTLWLSVFALGYRIPFPAALLVVPLGSIAGMNPLPGGIGGVEAAFAALLVATTGLSLPVATAAVLLYRGAAYWVPTVFGGGVVAMFGAASRR